MLREDLQSAPEDDARAARSAPARAARCRTKFRSTRRARPRAGASRAGSGATTTAGTARRATTPTALGETQPAHRAVLGVQRDHAHRQDDHEPRRLHRDRGRARHGEQYVGAVEYPVIESTPRPKVTSAINGTRRRSVAGPGRDRERNAEQGHRGTGREAPCGRRRAAPPRPQGRSKMNQGVDAEAGARDPLEQRRHADGRDEEADHAARCAASRGREAISARPALATQSAVLGWVEMPVSNQSARRGTSSAQPSNDMSAAERRRSPRARAKGPGASGNSILVVVGMGPMILPCPGGRYVGRGLRHGPVRSV